MSFILTNEELGLPETATKEDRAAALSAACRNHRAMQETGGQKPLLTAIVDAYAAMAASGLPASFDDDPVTSALHQRIAELGQPTANTKGT